MNHPKISVIVPVYKAERYLRICLGSLTGQSHKNLEILLVDDGSPDGSGAICDEYAARDRRIKVIHKENGGVSSARNAGLAVATGDWIGFVDADDWVEPDAYEYLLQMGLKHGADVVQCGLFLDEEAGSQEKFCAEEERFLSGGAAHYRVEDWPQIGNSTCNKLYRAECLKQITYDPQCPMGEDLLFNIQVLQNAFGIVLGTEAKYHYVQHAESVCHTSANAALVRSHRGVLKQIARQLGSDSAGQAYFETERLKMDMHSCSVMVRFPNADLVQLKNEIRTDIRKETLRFLTMPHLSAKERVKLFLIAWAWNSYQILLRLSKKIP